MFLFYVLSFFKNEDIIQGGTLFKGGHYLRKYGISNRILGRIQPLNPLFKLKNYRILTSKFTTNIKTFCKQAILFLVYFWFVGKGSRKCFLLFNSSRRQWSSAFIHKLYSKRPTADASHRGSLQKSWPFFVLVKVKPTSREKNENNCLHCSALHRQQKSMKNIEK